MVAKLASDGETVVLSGRSDPALDARRHVVGGSIVGRVTDSASGQGLGGASVKVGGTKLSTVTSDSGHFTLRDVPPGDQVLSVRLFGYKPAERTVTVVDSQRTVVKVVMVSVPTVLSGVVTTATGFQRKVEVGNDITTINVDSVMQVAPISSVTDLLETRVPGLTVLHSDGVPGDPSRIRIRGASSITGNNDPIVIADGIRVYASQSNSRNQNLAPSQNVNISTGTSNAVGTYAAPSPLDQIDPNSIATIEVLKGPSASALYGSDAANGVIIITTKHGRAGPTQWSLDLGDGVNWLPGNWPVNYFKFGTGLVNQASGSPLCVWYDLTCQVDSVVPFQALNDPRYTVFTHGSDQTASLSVSGGVPTLQYSVTGSGAGDVGNLKLPAIEVQRYEKFYGPIPSYLVHPDNYQTWGVNGQLTAQPASTMRVTLQSSLLNGHQQQGSLQQAISQLEGEYIDPTQLASTPLLQNDVERATDDQVTSTNAVSMHWQPRPWLPLDVSGGLNTIQRNDATYIPYGVNACAEGGVNAIGQENGNSCGFDTTGYYGLGRGTSQDKTLQVGTNVPVRFLTLGLGANLTNETTADVTASTNQLAPGVSTPTSFPTLNNASSFSQSTTAWSTYGWYVQPQIKIGNTYINPGFRLDGGSASGSQAGLTGFPKIDVSYLAVDQSRPRGPLTLLRPRLAFGYAGTHPGPTEKLRLINVGGSGTVSLDGSAQVPQAFISTIGNTLLRPERSRELEGGLDAELWHGRFSVTYTQYNKTRDDAIIPIPVAPSVNDGVSLYQQYVNIGEIRNTGTAVTLNVLVLESRAVSWTVGANMSNDNNVVVRLNPGQSTITNGGQRIQAGYPLWGTWAIPIVSFTDANHDGFIEPTEIGYGDSAVFVGQTDPKYQLNLNTGLTLLNGRLSVNATFAYQNGLTQFDDGALTSGAFALLPNTPGASLATQAAMVAAGACQGTGCQPFTDIGLIQTVNTFRFDALSINYTVPRTVSDLLHVPRMVVALQGKNLGLHSNYRGKDPDVNVFSTNIGGNGDQTVDAGQLPQPRTWWLKFTLGN
jgi:TonB-dependent SusC/RagA subfamily outer membrane receptor